MSEKSQTLIILGILLVFMIELIRTSIEITTPRYLKPKSFLRMGDVETPLTDGYMCEPIKVKHSYIEECGSDMFFVDAE
jgi:hypothetical protein